MCVGGGGLVIFFVIYFLPYKIVYFNSVYFIFVHRFCSFSFETRKDRDSQGDRDRRGSWVERKIGRIWEKLVEATNMMNIHCMKKKSFKEKTWQKRKRPERLYLIGFFSKNKIPQLLWSKYMCCRVRGCFGRNLYSSKYEDQSSGNQHHVSLGRESTYP